MTADVQFSAPGRYVVAVCHHCKELSLTFARRHPRWDLADLQLTEDGEPLGAARCIYAVIRLTGPLLAALLPHGSGRACPDQT